MKQNNANSFASFWNFARMFLSFPHEEQKMFRFSNVDVNLFEHFFQILRQRSELVRRRESLQTARSHGGVVQRPGRARWTLRICVSFFLIFSESKIQNPKGFFFLVDGASEEWNLNVILYAAVFMLMFLQEGKEISCTGKQERQSCVALYAPMFSSDCRHSHQKSSYSEAF